MATTIGHHTCNKEGGKEFVLAEAPFRSTYNSNKDRFPFLGEGYYYWDYDLKYAKVWGKINYQNSFYIIVSNLNMPDDVYLDLVGSKLQMDYFIKLMYRFRNRGLNAKNWQLSRFIEFMKKFREKDYSAFPFEIIRSFDFKASNDRENDFFFNDMKNFTNLTPRYIICFISKSDVFLQTKEIAFES